MTVIYKIVPLTLWREAEESGVFKGAPIDLSDGYIHFSTAEQVAETAALHFAGQKDLLLIAVDGSMFGDSLKFEPSRGGKLFPHLYSSLPVEAAAWVKPMQLGAAGRHVLPDLAS